jgi:hypothetical protein
VIGLGFALAFGASAWLIQVVPIVFLPGTALLIIGAGMSLVAGGMPRRTPAGALEASRCARSAPSSAKFLASSSLHLARTPLPALCRRLWNRQGVCTPPGAGGRSTTRLVRTARRTMVFMPGGWYEGHAGNCHALGGESAGLERRTRGAAERRLGSNGARWG